MINVNDDLHTSIKLTSTNYRKDEFVVNKTAESSSKLCSLEINTIGYQCMYVTQ